MRGMVVRPLLSKNQSVSSSIFGDKGPVKLVAEHNQAGVVCYCQEPPHFTKNASFNKTATFIERLTDSDRELAVVVTFLQYLLYQPVEPVFIYPFS
ncbi:Uncharacterised protein [Cedecea neteri]|uniref:Uncharacterized protein n=1 Tax=Cedecea neteri TaxID=158822 RepID=A0A2X2SVL6_9ENTR|nr:Uncharacterised protein [Cedecea neteri]